MGDRTLIGNVGQNTFETDQDEIRFIVQESNVLVLSPDAIEIPVLDDNDGLIRITNGFLSVDTQVDTKISNLEAGQLLQDLAIEDLDIRVTNNEVELEDHEIRITALENEPAFDIAPLTLDPANNRVGVNKAIPICTLDVLGSSAISGNFAIGKSVAPGSIRLDVNGLSLFRQDIVCTQNIIADQDVFGINASFSGKVEAGTNCYMGNYSTGTFACFRNKATATLQNDYALIQDAVGRTILNSSASQLLNLRQGNVSRMTINNGDVGIGTETPADKLHVVGNARLSGTAPVLRIMANENTSFGRLIFGHGTGTNAFTLRAGMPSNVSQPNRLDLFIGTGEAGADQIFSIRPDEVVLNRNTTINGGATVTGTATINNCFLSPYTSGNYALFAHKNSPNRTVSGYCLMQENNGTTFINSSGTQPLLFRQNNVDRMRVLTDGSVDITSTLLVNQGISRMMNNREIAPDDIGINRMMFGFGSYNNNNASPWADVLHLNSWNEGSGGSTNCIMFSKNGGFGIRQWQGTFGSSDPYLSAAGQRRDCCMAQYERPMSFLMTGTQSFPGNNGSGVYSFSHGLGAKWTNVISVSGMYRYGSSEAWRPMAQFGGFTPVALYLYIEFVNSTSVVVRTIHAGFAVTLEYRIVINYQDT